MHIEPGTNFIKSLNAQFCAFCESFLLIALLAISTQKCKLAFRAHFQKLAKHKIILLRKTNLLASIPYSYHYCDWNPTNFYLNCAYR